MPRKVPMGKTEPVYTRILASQKRDLEERARRNGFSLAMVLRLVIAEGLASMSEQERAS